MDRSGVAPMASRRRRSRVRLRAAGTTLPGHLPLEEVPLEGTGKKGRQEGTTLDPCPVPPGHREIGTELGEELAASTARRDHGVLPECDDDPLEPTGPSRHR